MPISTIVRSSEGAVTAYPAIIDREDFVSLRLLADPEAAEIEHRKGVRRLLALVHRKTVRRMLRDWPRLGAMRMAYVALGGREDLEDECHLLVVETAVKAAPLAAVRTQGEFHAIADAIEPALSEAFTWAMDVADRILRQARAVRTLLEAPTPPAWLATQEDVREQLGFLIGQRPFSERSVDRLKQLPRYLAGAEARLRKLATGGLDKDQRRWRDVEPRWRRWVEFREAFPDSGGSAAVQREADAYRWMLEEFRVSVFAQELGTVGRVSGARLDDQWSRLRDVVRRDGLSISGYAGG
ncbi:MAG: DUF3418 domain-containing protein [Phycisphaerales bacterium]|nr:DUF3418 domain-containing protein [Phycisphaerales bacterium]